jgi:Na+/melibiose symporter-like transporter
MGFLSDHTISRWGKRRPWLFIPLAFMMLLYEMLNTIIGINYSALYSELFQTLVARTRVAIFYETGNILGVVVG